MTVPRDLLRESYGALSGWNWTVEALYIPAETDQASSPCFLDGADFGSLKSVGELSRAPELGMDMRLGGTDARPARSGLEPECRQDWEQLERLTCIGPELPDDKLR